MRKNSSPTPPGRLWWERPRRRLTLPTSGCRRRTRPHSRLRHGGGGDADGRQGRLFVLCGRHAPGGTGDCHSCLVAWELASVGRGASSGPRPAPSDVAPSLQGGEAAAHAPPDIDLLGETPGAQQSSSGGIVDPGPGPASARIFWEEQKCHGCGGTGGGSPAARR